MFEKLANFAAKQLELDVAEITPDSTFESLGIDSLDIVEMIMDLETELGIELEMEDHLGWPGMGLQPSAAEWLPEQPSCCISVLPGSWRHRCRPPGWL